MSDQIVADALKALILRVEEATGPDERLAVDISETLCIASYITDDGDPTASIDAALTLLPHGADWRRLIDKGIAAYAANPYNAQAQKRHDGYGATIPLQICSAALKVRLASVEQRLGAQRKKRVGAAQEEAA